MTRLLLALLFAAAPASASPHLLSYESLKSVVSDKSLDWQHVERVDRYELFAVDGTIHYEATIFKAGAAVVGSDPAQEAARVADFEANYKSDSNRPAAMSPILMGFAGRRFFTTTIPVANVDFSEVDSLLFVNPSTSTARAMMDKLYLTSLTTDSSVKYRLYIQPTVASNGTALTVRNSYTAATRTSQMKAYRAPTISSRGAFIHMYVVTDSSLIDMFDGRVVIGPGTRLLLTTQVTVANSDWNLTFSWFER